MIVDDPEQDNPFLAVIFPEVNPLDGERVTKGQRRLGETYPVVANIRGGLEIVLLEVQVQYYGLPVAMSRGLLKNRQSLDNTRLHVGL